jgi:hypothetical protein
MFSALMDRAQEAVNNIIGQVVNRAIVAVPFVLAGAFAIAALAFRLIREFGPETGNLILAGVFLVLGVLGAFIFRVKPASETSTSASEALPDFFGSEEETAPENAENMSEPDRELLMAALASAAPVALPVVLRLVLRHLPLVLAALAAMFVLSRVSSASAEPAPVVQ